MGGPEVLILDVDEGPRPLQRLLVPAGDAALARWREGVTVSTVGIRAKDLDRVSAHNGRIGLLDRQRPSLDLFAADTVGDSSPWRALERLRVSPAFAKD